MSKLADALWQELSLGVLARSRPAFDACEAAHAEGKIDACIARAVDAFATREDNWKEAAQAVFARLNRRDLKREFDSRMEGKRADFVTWLYDLALANAKDLANSRFFLDPPFPDRVWVQRETSWDLAWRHEGDWKLKNLKAVRESHVPPLEALLRVRVAGVERANPRLPRA